MAAIEYRALVEHNRLQKISAAADVVGKPIQFVLGHFRKQAADGGNGGFIDLGTTNLEVHVQENKMIILNIEYWFIDAPSPVKTRGE